MTSKVQINSNLNVVYASMPLLQYIRSCVTIAWKIIIKSLIKLLIYIWNYSILFIKSLIMLKNKVQSVMMRKP